MRKPMARSLMLLTGLILISGCGLSEYQEKMTLQQQLIERLDEENKVLGSPLMVTQAIERKDGTFVDVYLRPPKNVSSTPDEMLFREMFLLYRGSDKINMYLATAVKDKNKSLQREVLEFFPRTSKVTRSTVQNHPLPGKQAITLRLLSFEERPEEDKPPKSTYYVYITPRNDLAVVYQVTGDPAISAQAREMSISTLGVGPDAQDRRMFYSVK